MGVHEGRAQLNKAMKELLARWNETRSSWDDSRSREFEEKYVNLLATDLKTTLTAMDHLAILMQQVQRDCE
jgi:hypothetical protein